MAFSRLLIWLMELQSLNGYVLVPLVTGVTLLCLNSRLVAIPFYFLQDARHFPPIINLKLFKLFVFSLRSFKHADAFSAHAYSCVF